jgi:uncharacterized protein YdhG (YjbR/CyaY superfamily)
MNEVEKYISSFEGEVKERLQLLRLLFFEENPSVEESIRYNMPAYQVGKHHLYFAAYKNHVGFYPVYGLVEIEPEIEKYRAKGTKDTLHFMHNNPLPIDLIKRIIQLKTNQK